MASSFIIGTFSVQEILDQFNRHEKMIMLYHSQLTSPNPSRSKTYLGKKLQDELVNFAEDGMLMCFLQNLVERSCNKSGVPKELTARRFQFFKALEDDMAKILDNFMYEYSLDYEALSEQIVTFFAHTGAYHNVLRFVAEYYGTDLNEVITVRYEIWDKEEDEYVPIGNVQVCEGPHAPPVPVFVWPSASDEDTAALNES